MRPVKRSDKLNMMKKLLDKDIREPLFLYLEIKYGKARFFEEKTIGRSRADVMMVTDDAITGPVAGGCHDGD